MLPMWSLFFLTLQSWCRSLSWLVLLLVLLMLLLLSCARTSCLCVEPLVRLHEMR